MYVIETSAQTHQLCASNSPALQTRKRSLSGAERKEREVLPLIQTLSAVTAKARSLAAFASSMLALELMELFLSLAAPD